MALRCRGLRTFIRFGTSGEWSYSIAMRLKLSPKPTVSVPEYLNVYVAPVTIIEDVTALIASCHVAVPNALLMVQLL